MPKDSDLRLVILKEAHNGPCAMHPGGVSCIETYESNIGGLGLSEK